MVRIKISMFAVLLLLNQAAFAQVVAPVYIPPADASVAARPDASVSYGPTADYPEQYDYWYQRGRNEYLLNPYLYVPVVPVTRPPVPPVAPFTAVQHGQVVESVLESPEMRPSAVQRSTETLSARVEAAGAPGERPLVKAQVLNVLDRGILLLDTGEEARLRGVSIPSENDLDEVIRYYARTGIDALRRLVMTGPVLVQVGTPERASDGYLLLDVYIDDGTLVNRQMLENGFGRFNGEDFSLQQVAVTLQAAEVRAREARRGIHSTLR